MSSATLNHTDFFPRGTYSPTEGSITFQSLASNALNWVLDKLFGNFDSMGLLVPDRAGVYEYLIKHYDMKDVVFAACVAARESLDLRYQLSLELYQDPEEDDEHLVLFVRQNKYDKDIMKTIEAIDEKFDSDMKGKSGWFLVTTDFERPISY